MYMYICSVYVYIPINLYIYIYIICVSTERDTVPGRWIRIVAEAFVIQVAQQVAALEANDANLSYITLNQTFQHAEPTLC